MSHSEDTGLSIDQNVANHEITSKKAALDDDDQGVGFSPNISDLDSLWSYWWSYIQTDDDFLH